MRAAFYTLGCKVNQYETTALLELFVREGFEIVDHTQEAEVYVLNSCTVTAESDKKMRQMLRRFRRQNPAGIVALLGCFPQAFPDAAEKLPEADIILGASNKKDLVNAVKERLAESNRIISIKDYDKNEEFESLQISTFESRTRAFVKIQDGCQRYCAYCIIPTSRGPVRSKPLEALEKELIDLANAGYKEVVLVGINLSCYGTDLGYRLLDAVKLACSISGIMQVRLGSLEPELLEPDIIKQLALEPKLCPQFHLSLQSGSAATLKRMRRHYTTNDYRSIVKSLRLAFADAAITTDIMVGFPGESPEEFQESLNFAREIGFARAHVFAYSRRSGTLADKMEDQISRGEKQNRSRKMIEVTDETRKDFLARQIGSVQSVLVESKEGKFRTGYTPNYTHVKIKDVAEKDLWGQIVAVKILSVEEDSCIGILNETTPI